MGYADHAKQCIQFSPADSDDGAYIQSQNVVGTVPTNEITVDLELRPVEQASGRHVLFDWAEYDGLGNFVEGINIQRFKRDLEVTIGGAAGSFGWANIGPVFQADNERVFVRIAIETQFLPPRQCRVRVWRNYDAVFTSGWSNHYMDQPTGPDVKWTLMGRKPIGGGNPQYPFLGKLYQAAIRRRYMNNVGVDALDCSGQPFACANYYSIYDMTESSGSDLIDCRNGINAELIDGTLGTWEWVAEQWMYDPEYAGMREDW